MVYEDVQQFCRVHFVVGRKQRFIYDKHKKYLRIGAGFDIETTRKETYAYMYHWQVSYGNDQLIGRTWYAFDMFVQQLQLYLSRLNARLIVWVANLGHEFAFLGRRYHWENVFARESHQPLVAQNGRIEYRECLTISGQGGLANLAKNYTTTQKSVGDLDYTKMRNSQTPLTVTEKGYTINDVKILAEFGEYIFCTYSDKKLAIPMTATGIVRNMIKNAAGDNIRDIKAAIKAMFPNRETYNFIMTYLFRGGYTHANAWWVCVVWDGVIGADFTSSYPAVMLSSECYYPKSEFIPIDLQTDGRYITDDAMDRKCVWFVATFTDIDQKTMHTVESQHKIIAYQNAKFDNGRLICADSIRVALTEIDYQIYTMFYTWETITIERAFCAVRGALPNYVRDPLKHYYKIKNQLKKQYKSQGIAPDDMPDYRNAKAIVNSYYGCMVQRLNFTDLKYDEVTGEWSEKPSTKTYNKMIQHIILYPYWGIYVTAWARLRLLQTVYALDNTLEGNNVIYCDTDSVYMVDTPENRAVIAAYNNHQSKINAELPAEFDNIGCFDWIGGTDANGNPQTYRFKTLGAKRYIKYHDGNAEIVVAGMRKGSMEKALCRTFATDNSYLLYKDRINKKGKIGYIDIGELFEKFTDHYILSCDESDKNAAVYEPQDYEAEIIDENGNAEIMHEMCGVAIVPIPFSIKMDKIYIMLLHDILENRRIPVCR